MSARPSRFASQRLSENPEFRSRLVAHSFLGAPHWGDSGVWLSTRVRPTIAECEGVANVSVLIAQACVGALSLQEGR